MASAQLIPDAACCADLAGVDGYVGASIEHPDARDGTNHRLDVYWRNAPPGRRVVDQPEQLDPLTIAEPLHCPCSWSGQVTGGAVQ